MAKVTNDFDFICSKIEDEKEFLNTVSQEIWRNPELKNNEIQAHAFLTNTFSQFGFSVQKNYLLNTAFRGEYVSANDSGPTIAILLEYDALPEIGHACGHNLISEAGLAASMAVKSLMESDSTIAGKLVVMGTPAEESGGGKIKLIEKGAFKDIDVALMVHPTNKSCASPSFLYIERAKVEFKGKESHAATSPWEGENALDAAVVFYNNLSVLRQQVKPTHRIHAIITEGGTVANVIPNKSRLELSIRTPTAGELAKLKSKVEMCIKGAAIATECEAIYTFDEAGAYQNLISNKILAKLYKDSIEKLGFPTDENTMGLSTGSTDMGNVSHVIPSLHPVYAIPSRGINHTKEFTDASGSLAAQEPTLAAAKAMAMTVAEILRKPNLLQEIKEQFKIDILSDMENS